MLCDTPLAMAQPELPKINLTRLLLAALLAAAGVAAHDAYQNHAALPEGKAKHAVLVVFDTLRADRMSIYGHTTHTTPYLEQASGKLLRYGSARAAAPWTVPAHASMFTGLWPSEHRAQWGSFRLAESHLTLAEILASQGFCTVGLSANPFLGEANGLDQGFGSFKVLEKQTSREILAEAGRVLDHAADCGRLFLFVNLMDTHIPYSFGTYANEFGVSQPPILSADDKWATSAGKRVLTTNELEQHRAAYDAAVRVTDDLARTVIEMLQARNLLDETLVVFTSDHGEGLGQHQEMGHVLSVWEEQLDVPLMVRLPGARRGGEVFPRRVSMVGLTPSIIDWLAVPRPRPLAQRPTLEETADEPILAEYRSYFSEGERGFNSKMRNQYPELAARISHHHVLYCANDKLIVSPGGRTQFFDLAADPAEQHDLAGDDPAGFLPCLARYNQLFAAGRFSPFDRRTSESPLSEEDLERLKSLGYVQ